MLLVRADDIPEYVQDGVVDCGITGLDLVRERATHVEELLKLGFGSCRLDAAVPAESAYQRLEDLEGATVATVFPRLTRELMPVPVELVEITGSVEVAPRLGLADAIVDLVSSGNTMRMNGLRSLGSLFSSEAVLIGREGADATQIVAMMRAVVEARAHRYLMLNAPHAELDARLRDHRLALAERAAASPRRAWSRCTRSCRRRTCGSCCRGSRRPARRRSWSCPSSG